MTEAWAQIVATVIGGLLTVLGGFIAYRMSVARDREAKRVEWERQRIEAEKKGLREIQETLCDVFETAMQVSIKGMGQTVDQRGISSHVMAYHKVNVLASWIYDDGLRSMVYRASSAASSFALNQDREKSDELQNEASARLKQAVDRIGEVARGLAIR